jgi:hypothetical protein
MRVATLFKRLLGFDAVRVEAVDVVEDAPVEIDPQDPDRRARPGCHSLSAHGSPWRTSEAGVSSTRQPCPVTPPYRGAGCQYAPIQVVEASGAEGSDRTRPN